MFEMLSSLEVINFRCFNKHKVPFKSTSFIVGENNAGKSTLIETLRLVSLAQHKYKNGNYVEPPEWLDGKIDALRCLKVPVSHLDLPPGAIFHYYRDPPAQITAQFNSGEKIEVYVGNNYQVYAVPFRGEDAPIESRSEANLMQMPRIEVLPPLAQLALDEKPLQRDTVLEAIGGRLSSIHFRNELKLFYDKYYQNFVKLSEETWDDLKILGFDKFSYYLSLMVKDAGFEAEVGWVGSGLKMWLQIMWFLTRAQGAEVLVLDEPDIYMHPDLQRKLARIVRSFNSQTILTTHSGELLSEVDPGEVLIVDKKNSVSNFATSLKSVQTVVENMGGVENFQLYRLWNAKRFLVVEGRDIEFLSKIHELLYPNSKLIFANIPHQSIGGWGGWQRVLGTKDTFKNGFGDQITIYCMLDSDYKSIEEKQARQDEARRENIGLHIWKRKEIENYLLDPELLSRTINSLVKRGGKKTTPEETRAYLDSLMDKWKNYILDSISTEVYLQNREKGISYANNVARDRVDKAWSSFEGKLSIVSGKDLLSRIFQWAQDNFKVSPTIGSLFHYMITTDLDNEIIDVISAIENLTTFP